MTKILIAAIFLSQAPIQDVEYINYGDPSYIRRVNPIHIRVTPARTVVVPTDGSFTQKAPIPYVDFWRCPLNQTAQQCIAIESLVQQELPGKSMLDLKWLFPDPLGK